MMHAIYKCEPINFPVDGDDQTIHMTTIKAQIPEATGLKYEDEETRTCTAIRLVDGLLYPPQGEWGIRYYRVVVPTGT